MCSSLVPSHDLPSPDGQHLSRSEITELMAASDAARDAVLSWLRSEGVPSHAVSINQHRDVIAVTVPADLASRLFGGEFSLFQVRVCVFVLSLSLSLSLSF